MILLTFFAFLGGFITILSPCILPILPIVLSGTIGSRKKPVGIVIGFILSFTIFTLFLATIVKLTNIPSDILRNISVVIILIFGISLLIPNFQVYLEKLFSKFSNKFSVSGKHEGLAGGLLIGLSLGLIWTPCVGPILASIITLAATSEVTINAIIITFAYALGTAIPMLIIMISGRKIFEAIPWLLPNTPKLQKFFGVLMIITAIAIYFNIDKTFQTFILDKFPSYGTKLTTFEDNDVIRQKLNELKNTEVKFKNPVHNSELFNENYKTPELTGINNWINSQPLLLEELKGKVVLIDFWTYTCINCIRSLPYIVEWNEKYKDKGLIVIGVHSPEFEFEKNTANVEKAVKQYNITYPVAQDNNFYTWNAFNNLYWPAKYLIDKDGYVRYTHFGEGEYEKTEKAIQELLKEAGNEVENEVKNDDNTSLNKISYQNISPETYLGSIRMQYLFPNGKSNNGVNNFKLLKSVPRNNFSFGGTWEISDEYSKSIKDSELNYNFNAKNIYLVMRSTDGSPKRVEIKLNDKNVIEEKGKDVSNSSVFVTEDRLYELINLQNTQNGSLWLKFEPGIEVFAFTFG